MSVLPTLILVTSMLFVKILWAHTPVRVRRDIQGMEKHVMVSYKMKDKMSVKEGLSVFSSSSFKLF